MTKTKGLFKYNAKTLFTGYKIGLKNPSLYVGVPKKYFKRKRTIPVRHDGKTKFLTLGKHQQERTFNDRFRPGETYTLVYFLWEKVKKQEVE